MAKDLSAKFLEDPGIAPLLESSMRGTAGADARRIY
jgi:hypothetical protein